MLNSAVKKAGFWYPKRFRGRSDIMELTPLALRFQLERNCFRPHEGLIWVTSQRLEIGWLRAYNQTADDDTWDEDSEWKVSLDGDNDLVSEDVLLQSWFQQGNKCDQLSVKHHLVLWLRNSTRFPYRLVAVEQFDFCRDKPIRENWRSFSSANSSSEESATLLADKQKWACLRMSLATCAAIFKSLRKELKLSHFLVGLSAFASDLLTSRKIPTKSAADSLRCVLLTTSKDGENGQRDFLKKMGPLTQQFSQSALAGIPRVPVSAGLSAVGAWYHSSTVIDSKISLTLLATKTGFLSSVWSHCKTVLLSDHMNVWAIWMFEAFWMSSLSQVANKAASSSSLDIDKAFVWATQSFMKRNWPRSPEILKKPNRSKDFERTVAKHV